MVAYSYAEGTSHRAEHIVYTKSRLGINHTFEIVTMEAQLMAEAEGMTERFERVQLPWSIK